MTIENFLEKARANISDDPNTRLTFLAKAKLEHPDCIVDIHAHIFDKKCLSVGYILLRMLKSLTLEALGIEAVDNELEAMELLRKKEDEVYNDIEIAESDEDKIWDQLEKELEKTVELHDTYELFGFDLKAAYKVLRKGNMLEVLDFYHSHFSITNLDEFTNSKMVVGILQMDLETGWGYSPRRGFLQQIKDIKDISKKRAILPFLAVDPRRVDAPGADNLYKIFLDVFTDPHTPFFGVKCYPAMGYFPSDVRLDPIFQICAEKNIPVLTHCGGEAVSTFKKTINIKDAEGYRDVKLRGSSRKERARFLNNPSHWDPVLHKYNNLKLNLGHFGGDHNWQEFGKTGANARITKIFEMMVHPNYRVYGDFSFNIVEKELFTKFKEILDTKPEIKARTLYGTDYWVVLPAGELLDMQKLFLEKLKDHQDAMLRTNVLEYLLK